jgi:hypothetical protein
MSTRETILSNLETALQTIPSVAYVTRKATGMTDLDSSRIPALLISDDGEESPETKIGTDQRVTAKISIAGMVKAPDNLSTFYNDILADVRKCILSSSLGANVIYRRLGMLRTWTGDDVITFSQDLEILYYYSEVNP